MEQQWRSRIPSTDTARWDSTQGGGPAWWDSTKGGGPAWWDSTQGGGPAGWDSTQGGGPAGWDSTQEGGLLGGTQPREEESLALKDEGATIVFVPTLHYYSSAAEMESWTPSA